MPAPSGNTTSTDIADVLPTIISPARDALEQPTVMMNKVTKVRLKDGDGSSVNMPKFSTLLDVQSLSENNPINNPQKLIPTPHQFTTSEVGCEVILTDRAVRRTPEAMRARAGRMMGNAMKRFWEEQLLALFPGLSRGLGAAGSAFDVIDIAAAYTRLIAGAETGQTEPIESGKEVHSVIHPFHYFDVWVAADTLGSNSEPIPNGMTQEMTKTYWQRQIANTQLYTAPLIPIDGAADAIGAVFTSDAFLYISTSLDAKVETDRDINLRAWDIVMTKEAGTGELDDQYGFKLTADATEPT